MRGFVRAKVSRSCGKYAREYPKAFVRSFVTASRSEIDDFPTMYFPEFPVVRSVHELAVHFNPRSRIGYKYHETE